ncbi:hypothetical protein GS425_12630 [Rhodococcus hoagii]|nr:hypothetical protein [Prescottella equi]
MAFDPAVGGTVVSGGAEELGEGVDFAAGEAFGDGVGGVAVAEFLRECFGHSEDDVGAAGYFCDVCHVLIITHLSQP